MSGKVKKHPDCETLISEAIYRRGSKDYLKIQSEGRRPSIFRQILNQIKDADHSNIPTLKDEISPNFLRIVINQYLMKHGQEPLNPSCSIDNYEIFDCKYNVGDLSSTYQIRVIIEEREKEFEFVAKLLPTNDDGIIAACSTQVFEKEISIYFELLSAIKCEVDASLQYMISDAVYASHNNKGAGVLVFKSCLMDGFSSLVIRRNGLSESHLITSVKALARFHAYGRIFIDRWTLEAVERRYPYLLQTDLYDSDFLSSESRDLLDTYGDFLTLCDEELGGNRHEKFLRVLKLSSAHTKEMKFVTVCHGEFWENNLMFDEKEKKVMILDWKNARIANGPTDLAFFLLTSASEPKMMDVMFRAYYESFQEYYGDSTPFDEKELRTEYENCVLDVLTQAACTLVREMKHLNDHNHEERLRLYESRAQNLLNYIREQL